MKIQRHFLVFMDVFLGNKLFMHVSSTYSGFVVLWSAT